MLTKLNRLANFSTDIEEIASALRKSQSGLLQVFEDNSKIRRDPIKTLKIVNFIEPPPYTYLQECPPSPVSALCQPSVSPVSAQPRIPDQ